MKYPYLDYDLETEDELQEVETIENSSEEEEEEDLEGEDLGDFIASEDNNSVNNANLGEELETLVVNFQTKDANEQLKMSMKAINISGEQYPIQVSVPSMMGNSKIFTKELVFAVVATEDKEEMYRYLEPYRKYKREIYEEVSSHFKTAYFVNPSYFQRKVTHIDYTSSFFKYSYTRISDFNPKHSFHATFFVLVNGLSQEEIIESKIVDFLKRNFAQKYKKINGLLEKTTKLGFAPSFKLLQNLKISPDEFTHQVNLKFINS